MEVVLNSRILIGDQHGQAVAFLTGRFDDEQVSVDWLESPSDQCILKLSEGTRDDLLATEHALRAYLGLPDFNGRED
ncbi:MAG TPA: hypothetical protein VGE67_16750 [Haloferula sp.]